MTDTVPELLAELAALEDPGMRAVNERNGDDHGVNLGKLRAIAKRLKTQQDLARELWATDETPARLLALLICRPKAFDADEIDQIPQRRSAEGDGIVIEPLQDIDRPPFEAFRARLGAEVGRVLEALDLVRQEAAGMRAAKRLGAGHLALAKARVAATKKGSNLRALLDAVPRELHGDPGYTFAKIQLLRREEKFTEAAQLMLSAPKDSGRLHNLDEWWIERRLLARKMLDVGEHRSAYLIARDAALPSRDIANRMRVWP